MCAGVFDVRDVLDKLHRINLMVDQNERAGFAIEPS
jgi:hypothetical protein